MSSVTLTSISRRWGTFLGVDDISLTVGDGEFVVFLGPSGCGKTTTMRMIAGLEEPSAGEIRIGDRLVNDVAPGDRDLAMVFQNYGLYPHMTVAQNIGYPMKVRGINVVERARRIKEAAARVELDSYLDRKPAALSGGQRQRVALARAIVRTPQLFLMDEPLSNLDAKLRVSMRGQLKHLQRELGTTTIYVTHDQVEAMTLADRVVVIEKGRLQQVGTPLEIYDRPANAFVAGFLGNPPMNLVQATIANGRLVHSGFSFAVVAPAGPVRLGQRPEDLRVVAPGEGDAIGEVYSAELLGDAVLITLRIVHDLISVKVDKGCRLRMGEQAGLLFDRRALHLFDDVTGARLADPGSLP